MHKKYFVVLAKKRNTVSCAQEALCCLGKGKKNCFLYIRNSLLSWQKKETLFPAHKKHFVVSEKERNTVFYVQETLCYLGKRKKHCFYAQETLCCLGKRKRHCFLCTRNTLLSVQKKEKLFPVYKKHFVVLAKERNTVSYTQETLCCLGKRKKHCFLCTKKHFDFLA